MAPTYLFPEGASFSADNLVLHAVARRHVVKDMPGPLSIKTVLRGRVAWTIEGRDLVLDPTAFLVLGDGDRYSMNIDELRPVETCCVFFQRGFVELLALDATSPMEASLDDPVRKAPSLPFLSRLHSGGPNTLLPQVQTLGPRCSAELRPSGFEEDFLLLGERLLQLYQQVRERIARVPAAKASTREELFRRLERAREFMHGKLDEPLSLEATARAACLSQYHFHRAFQRVYGNTPHEYLTGMRLQRARTLLEAGKPVLETCVEVGFTSASSFTRLFRTKFGAPPSALRRR